MTTWGYQLHRDVTAGTVAAGPCNRCTAESTHLLVWSYRSHGGVSVRACACLCRVHAQRAARIHNLSLPEIHGNQKEN